MIQKFGLHCQISKTNGFRAILTPLHVDNTYASSGWAGFNSTHAYRLLPLHVKCLKIGVLPHLFGVTEISFVCMVYLIGIASRTQDYFTHMTAASIMVEGNCALSLTTT